MKTLEAAADCFRAHPVLRLAFAAGVAISLVVTPFEAMEARHIKSGMHVDGYGEPCTAGCSDQADFCCNDPIG